MTTLEEQTITFGDNKKTLYLAAGPRHGPLLIFVHGWPAIAKIWKPQLVTFASIDFRVVAPDVPEDYAQENINLGMVALLEHLGHENVVWIGMSDFKKSFNVLSLTVANHDWGYGAVWSFAAHYPEKCVAVAGLAVPYGVLELGLEKLLKYVDRDLYPADEYPYGHWSCMKFYKKDFEKATSWFDVDSSSVIRQLYSKGDPAKYSKSALTPNVTKDGRQSGGISKPDPNWKRIPIERNVLDEETYSELVTAMEKTGFWSADAWYLNHTRGRAYTLEKWKNNGYLHMPVLFIHAKLDRVCATTDSRLGGPMRKYCTDLTKCIIDAGNWVAEEKPAETSAAITRWLVESCTQYWPGFWSNGHTKGKL